MKNRDTVCHELQNKIGKLIINAGDLTLRDICGILEMTKYFFLMEKYQKYEKIINYKEVQNDRNNRRNS